MFKVHGCWDFLKTIYCCCGGNKDVHTYYMRFITESSWWILTPLQTFPFWCHVSNWCDKIWFISFGMICTGNCSEAEISASGLRCVLPCIRVARAGLVYRICFCVYQPDSLPTQQKKDYHWGGRLSGAQKSVYFSWLDASQPLSLSHLSALPTSIFGVRFLHPSLMIWEGAGSSAWGTVALLSAWAVCRCSASYGPLSGCHRGAGMRRENFTRFVEGEIKHGSRLIWHPYLHGISPLSHRQLSQLHQM